MTGRVEVSVFTKRDNSLTFTARSSIVASHTVRPHIFSQTVATSVFLTAWTFPVHMLTGV